MAMHELPKPMPEGSSAFAKTLADFNKEPPIVQVTSADEADSRSRPTSTRNGKSKEDEGKIVHGLHYCYKVEGGQSIPIYNCNHDHHRVSQGHVEEIAKSANVLPSPSSPQRRMSIQVGVTIHGHNQLFPEEEEFRQRSQSDAVRRRVSMPYISPGHSPPKLSPKQSPQQSPSPARRRGSVNLQSGQLHHVYEQYLPGKK